MPVVLSVVNFICRAVNMLAAVNERLCACYVLSCYCDSMTCKYVECCPSVCHGPTYSCGTSYQYWTDIDIKLEVLSIFDWVLNTNNSSVLFIYQWPLWSKGSCVILACCAISPQCQLSILIWVCSWSYGCVDMRFIRRSWVCCLKTVSSIWQYVTSNRQLWSVITICRASRRLIERSYVD